MSFLDLYKQQIERFNQEVADLDGKNTNFNHTRPELGKKLYLLTKNFLDTYPDALNADEKAAVFEEYVRLWFASKCLLDIKDTRYAEAYKQSSFGKFGGGYNDRCPMTAGFNLSGARLKSQHADFIFLHVNFNKADFSKLTWVYGHFENCLMSQIQTTDQTNLNQSRFERCTLNSNDLTKVGLCESRLTGCSIIDTQLPKYISKRDCVDKAPYPTFLQQLRVSSKKLTAATVANSLWLTDKNSESTKASKSQFSLWAKGRALPFTTEEVEHCLSSTYVMRK